LYAVETGTQTLLGKDEGLFKAGLGSVDIGLLAGEELLEIEDVEIDEDARVALLEKGVVVGAAG
jgi:hypothetical protein